MDTTTLVREQIDDGQATIQELLRRGIDVSSAFWLQTTDDDQWRYYIVTPRVDEQGSLQTYREVQTAIRGMTASLWINPLEVRILGTQAPLAKAVFTFQQRHPNTVRRGTHCPGDLLGMELVKNAYLYPLPTVAKEKVAS
jgi:hypothetical protein